MAAKQASTAPVALYYPHTRVQSESLLKTGLLLWDHIDCIVPSDRFTPEPRALSAELREAEELLVRSRVPTESEKKNVHSRVGQLVANGIPSWIYEELKGADSRHFLVYPNKLSDETWALLSGARLARLVGTGGRDYQVPPALGLLLMSMLADECAGTTTTRVTDRSRAYSWLMGVTAHSLGGEYVPNLDASHLSSTYDRLVTAAVRIVDTDGIPIERLLELRRREAAGASDYTAFRRRYVERIAAYIEKLNTAKLRPADVREIDRQYRIDMKTDLRLLKQELRLAAAKVVFRDIGIAVLAGVGATALHPLAGLSGVGALLHSRMEYRQARRAALQKSAMSWLYLSERSSMLF